MVELLSVNNRVFIMILHHILINLKYLELTPRLLSLEEQTTEITEQVVLIQQLSIAINLVHSFLVLKHRSVEATTINS